MLSIGNFILIIMFSALILDLVFCHTEQPFRHLFSFEIGNGFKFYHQYLPYIVQHILRRLPVIVQLTADITEQHMTVFLEYDLKKSFLLLSHTLLSPSCYFAVLLFRARHICNVLRLSKSFVFSEYFYYLTLLLLLIKQNIAL